MSSLKGLAMSQENNLVIGESNVKDLDVTPADFRKQANSTLSVTTEIVRSVSI